ncbi:hypothetical protein [Pseudomonas sp. SBT1-2]|uniref:hypothetical protein n=1 Tax=Pseudomonas sp. SBT1-2 TaxID=3027852 RepID=UPI00235DF6A7|nr:hypothetical protein [Pseudomonas sp. SBT1-2]
MTISPGLKQVTPENWLALDPAWGGVYMPHEEGDGSVEWIRYVMAVTLDSSVPDEVQILFRTAQGAITYGLLFYPLMTLGCDQLLRSVEAAARAKCVQMNAPAQRSFSDAIAWLVKHNIIEDAAKLRWQSVRLLRNEASHPRLQQLFNVAMMKGQLELCVDCINSIFPGEE